MAVLPVKNMANPTTVDPFASLVAAAAGGDRAQVSSDAYLAVNNGSGSAVTVTVAAGVVCNFGQAHNLVTSVAAGAKVMIGPLTPAQYASSVDGQAAVTYSSATSVTVGSVLA